MVTGLSATVEGLDVGIDRECEEEKGGADLEIGK
jgi:hypothetical protein